MDQRLEDLRAEIWRVMALGQRLHAHAFEEASMCRDWTVGDVFAHLATDFMRYREWLAAAREGQADPPFARTQLAADNAIRLEAFTGVPGPDRVLAFEVAANDYLAELPDVDPELPQGNPIGTITVGDQVVFATLECAIHGWDVAAALDLEWHAPDSLHRLVEVWRRRRDEPLVGDDHWIAILAASGRTPA